MTSESDLAGLTPDQQVFAVVQRGDLVTLKTLLDADPKLANAWDENEGKSVLHYAVQFGTGAMVKYLLAQGADPLVKDRDDDATPLQRAIDVGAPQEIRTILSKAMQTAPQGESMGDEQQSAQ